MLYVCSCIPPIMNEGTGMVNHTYNVIVEGHRAAVTERNKVNGQTHGKRKYIDIQMVSSSLCYSSSQANIYRMYICV